MSKWGVEKSQKYTDNFGGIYLDEKGILNVGLVVSNSELKQIQQNSPYGDSVIYRKYEYSNNELQNIKFEVEKIVSDNHIDSIVSIEDKENVVSIVLMKKTSKALLKKSLRKQGIYKRKAIKIKVDSDTFILLD